MNHLLWRLAATLLDGLFLRILTSRFYETISTTQLQPTQTHPAPLQPRFVRNLNCSWSKVGSSTKEAPWRACSKIHTYLTDRGRGPLTWTSSPSDCSSAGGSVRGRAVLKWTRSFEKSTSSVQSKATRTFFSNRGNFSK